LTTSDMHTSALLVPERSITELQPHRLTGIELRSLRRSLLLCVRVCVCACFLNYLAVLPNLLSAVGGDYISMLHKQSHYQQANSLKLRPVKRNYKRTSVPLKRNEC
jgi:hypothetical protein